MPSWKVLEGDVREQLAALPDASVHCVATSPPYWGLRDYGTGTWEGGDPGCDHLRSRVTINEGFNARWGQGGGAKKQEHRTDPYRDECGKCGAVRVDRQIGLEETPEEYVRAFVAVFREVRRVLRDDGTVWLNLGDSYARSGSAPPRQDHSGGNLLGTYGKQAASAAAQGPARDVPEGLKEKDLVGVPWMVAFALRADGWYLRSDIVWAKPNPMPESVTDRPTRSHEFVFLLTKSARYFYDADAIREPHTTSQRRLSKETDENKAGRSYRDTGEAKPRNRSGKALAYAYRDGVPGNPGGRNKRDVWTIATKAFPDAHFAVFPPDLVEPCVKAGTSERGCCPACGAPRRRVVEKVRAPDPKAGRTFMRGAGHQRDRDGGPANREGREFESVVAARTTGWEPTCGCGAEEVYCSKCCTVVDGEEEARLAQKANLHGDLSEMPSGVPLSGKCPRCGSGPLLKRSAVKPCLVLDPFAGSGTTLLVANRLGRDAVGVELSPEFAAMIRRRLRGDMPLLAGESA